MKRSQVVKAFRSYAKKYAHPDDLPVHFPEVVEAHRLLDQWFAEEMAGAFASSKSDAVAWAEFSRTTLFFDAGFYDFDYLDEVIGEHLMQDLQDANSNKFYLLAASIRLKIIWIRLWMILC